MNMKIISGKSVVALALLLVLLATSLPGCGGSAPSLPIKAKLSFSEPPVLGKPVQLTATFDLMIDYPKASDITTRIVLPEGFEKVDGDLEWQGDIIRGNTSTLNATVKAVKTGDWKIEARASSGKSDGMGGYAVLYVSVSETGATVRSRPPGSPSVGCGGPKQIPIEPWQVPSPSYTP
jgi:hypothetical protein